MEKFGTDGVVSDVIDSPPPKQLGITYGTLQVHPGMTLTPTQVQNVPSITVEGEADSFYTLIMNGVKGCRGYGDPQKKLYVKNSLKHNIIQMPQAEQIPSLESGIIGWWSTFLGENRSVTVKPSQNMLGLDLLRVPVFTGTCSLFTNSQLVKKISVCKSSQTEARTEEPNTASEIL